jgi:hypothetical protein
MQSAYSQLQTGSMPAGMTAFMGTGEQDPGRTRGCDRQEET